MSDEGSFHTSSVRIGPSSANLSDHLYEALLRFVLQSSDPASKPSGDRTSYGHLFSFI
jgi:hypothetical protein